MIRRPPSSPLFPSPTLFRSTVDDAPVANDDAYSVNEGGTLSVSAPGVLGNDSDVDSGSFTAVLDRKRTRPNSSHYLTSDAVTCLHEDSETTSDTFTYKANDG